MMEKMDNMEMIEVEGVGAVRVRRGRNVKRLGVRVAPGRGVWVSVPQGVGMGVVKRFVEGEREWIAGMVREMAAREERRGLHLAPGWEIRTRLHVVRIEAVAEGVAEGVEQGEVCGGGVGRMGKGERSGEGGAGEVGRGSEGMGFRMEGERIVLRVPEGMLRGERLKRLEGVVGRFLAGVYREEARAVLPGRVRMWAERYGFRYGRLTFRDNVSNWGSCSGRDNISLNIRLMKLPDELVDYVILHELCHTVEKNHSEAFWRLVGTVCPGYEGLRRRLREWEV